MTAAGLLKASPRLAYIVIAAPVLAGLAGTVAPAFHIQTGPDLQAFATLINWPGLPHAILLSLSTGLTATLTALTLTLLITAALYDRPVFLWLHRSLAPLLAIPHAAAALGLAFLLAPSGWIARAISPWATGWLQPPDLLTLHDPWGLALTLGLTLKELPFLLVMTLAALPQIGTRPRMQLARTMGYGDIASFLLVVTPALYPALRLPILAVLTYAMTNIDMALILGPTRPPSLAVQITLWMTEASLTRTDLAAAAALTQAALTLLALVLWKLGEETTATLCNSITIRGCRLQQIDLARPAITTLAATAALTLTMAIAALALWSVAAEWPFPSVLPHSLTLTAWPHAALRTTTATTLIIAATSTALALTLSLLWLQAEYLFALPAIRPLLIYLPLLVPQICFLPGLEYVALQAGATGGIASVTAAHLIFVLPYTYLTLAGPFRLWDARLATTAATLGASNARIFWRLRLPMLLAPVLTAAAIGFAVSVAQYLPTLLVGGGRVTTLTTEALALASGGNRRVTSAYALLQTLLPIAAFALAVELPRWHHRRRHSKGAA